MAETVAGNVFEAWRKSQGRSQEEQAVACRVSFGCIRLWERGDGVPHVSKVDAVAAAYGVPRERVWDAIRAFWDARQKQPKARKRSK